MLIDVLAQTLYLARQSAPNFFYIIVGKNDFNQSFNFFSISFMVGI